MTKVHGVLLFYNLQNFPLLFAFTFVVDFQHIHGIDKLRWILGARVKTRTMVTRKWQRHKITMLAVLVVAGIGSAELSRIVGGTPTAFGAYPFFVRLEKNQGILECGGSLVARDVVLTAHHCDPQGDSEFITVVNAYTSPNINNSSSEFQTVTVDRRGHEDFSMETFANDFLLLK